MLRKNVYSKRQEKENFKVFDDVVVVAFVLCILH